MAARHISVLCCLLAVGALAADPPHPQPPADLLRALAHPGAFHLSHTTADIPAAVRSAFAKATHEDAFSLAEPGARWEPTDVISDPKLPRRRLFTVALGESFCLVFYEQGGIAKFDSIQAFRLANGRADLILNANLRPGVTTPAALAQAIHDKDYFPR